MREQNERKFPDWEALSSGRRRYWLDLLGRPGWKARYVKEVDVNEVTVRFIRRFTTRQGSSSRCTTSIL
jgi:hypothetical protein